MDDKEQLQNNLISIDINVFDSNIVNDFLLNDTGEFFTANKLDCEREKKKNNERERYLSTDEL